MQYSGSTVAVTYGSNTVWLNAAKNVSWAGIRPGALFTVQGDAVFYPVAQYRPGTSGARDSIVLTGSYRGATNSAAKYAITNDFTANLGLPLINRGDLETSTIYDYAMAMLDSTWKSIPGDMFKAVYDPTNRGYVDHAVLADTCPWAGITGVPTTFTPAHHANTHLPQAADPIAFTSTGQGGLCPPIDGTTIAISGGKLVANPQLPSPHAATHHVTGTDSIGLASTTVDGLCPPIDGSTIVISGGKLVATKTAPLPHETTHLPGGTDAIPLSSTTAAGLCPTVDGLTIQVSGNKLVAVGQVPQLHGPTHVATGTDPVPVASTTGTGICPQLDGVTVNVVGGLLTAVGTTSSISDTTAIFTVPPVGQTVTVTLTDVRWITVGQIVYVANAAGTGQAGALQVTAISGNTVTLLNPVPPGSIPLADSTQNGLLKKVSGATSDFVDGTNNCRNLLSSVPLATTAANGLLQKISGAATDYVGGDNACHGLVAALAALLVPTGTILDYGGFSAPTGFLKADGSAVSRTQYPALFAVLTIQTTGNTVNASPIISGMGTTTNMQVADPISGPGIPAGATVSSIDSATQIHISANATATATGVAIVDAPWGVGDGVTTFNLPDSRGRTSIGVGQSSGLTLRHLADAGGEENHALALGELAAHNHSIAAGQFSHGHTLNAATHVHVGGQQINYGNTNFSSTAPTFQALTTLNSGSYVYWSGTTDARTTGDTVAANTLPAGNTANTGSGTAHNTMMPYFACSKIIKT